MHLGTACGLSHMFSTYLDVSATTRPGCPLSKGTLCFIQNLTEVVLRMVSMSLPVSGGVWELDVDCDGCHVAAWPENVGGFGN